jgi:hypothetical protein
MITYAELIGPDVRMEDVILREFVEALERLKVEHAEEIRAAEIEEERSILFGDPDRRGLPGILNAPRPVS